MSTGYLGGGLLRITPRTTYTFQNALTEAAGVVKWGGTLTQNTIVDATSGNYDIYFANTTLAQANLLFIGGGSTAAKTGVGIGTSTLDATNPERLAVNAGTASSVNVIHGYADGNDYRQIGIKNGNHGINSSSDFVATADSGNETSQFINMGINGSGYFNAAFASGPLDAYLYNNGGNLYIGTASAAKGVIFHVAGTLAANQAGYITSTGKWGIGNGANTPFTLLANTNTSFGDGTRSVYAATGLSWISAEASAGFVSGFFNNSNTTGAGAVLARVTSTNAATYALHATVGASTTILSAAGNGRVGVGTATPASTFNNTANLTTQTDGTTALGTTGLGWQIATTGYAGAVVNTSTAIASNGLLVRIAASTNTSSVAQFLYGGTSVALSILSNGNVGFGLSGPATAANTSNSTVLQTDGTTTIATTGFGWQQASSGYLMAIVNTTSTTSANGLLVRTAANNSTASIARFLYNGTTVGLALMANGFVGVGLANPVSLLANTASAITDGVTTSTGISWASGGSNYAVGIANNNNAASSNGLLVRVTRNASDAYAARILVNGTTNALSVRADGRTNVGDTTAFNGILQVTTSGTTDAVYVKSATTATRGPLVFTQDDVQTWGVGPVGAGNQFQIDYSGANRGVFMDTNGNFGLGITSPTARLHVGTGGFVNTTIAIFENSATTKAYEIQTNGGTIYQSWFGVTPVVRQTGGAATAGATYGATEQAMLNAVYSAMRNYGLLT